MDYINKIKEKLKNNGGVITSKEFTSSNIPTIYLTRMVETGELIRIDRGIYINSSGDYDEYSFFQNKYTVAIFSYVSALYLQGFTDIIPLEIEATVYKGYNKHCQTMFGNTVKVYNLERTICDLIKNRNEVETELLSKTLNRYIKYSYKDLNRLYEYSKKMKIYEKVKKIMEILYE